MNEPKMQYVSFSELKPGETFRNIGSGGLHVKIDNHRYKSLSTGNIYHGPGASWVVADFIRFSANVEKPAP